MIHAFLLLEFNQRTSSQTIKTTSTAIPLVTTVPSFKAHHPTMEEPRPKRRRDITTYEHFLRIAKEVQNRSGQKICETGTEDRRFRDYFGCGVHVAILLWTLLDQNELLEENSTIEHMLWTMYFLKCYPREQEGCAAAGDAQKGACDPKTWRKYVWPMIYAMSDLESVVVRCNVLKYCYTG